MSMRWLCLVLFALSLSISACGGNDVEKGPVPCESGASQACTCDDGATGAQVCAGGTFGACQCGPSTCQTDDDCPGAVCGGDGVCAADSDGDGIADADDNCPDTSNPDQADVDGNGTGDACQPTGDSDGDGLDDLEDNCPDVQNPGQEDQDLDGIGDICDDDRDGDGVPNSEDNCPRLSNDRQTDSNGDGLGNACDTDSDGVNDANDNCFGLANPDQSDLDGDQAGDACDADRDGDEVANDVDICPDAADPDQLDTDGDGDGDACDDDDDNDGRSDASDNCPTVENPRQGDRDQDGIGDVCDDPDMDGIPDSEDNCPDEANPQQEDIDTDSDGILDCIERSLGLDPSDADSDGDGLDDLDEFQYQTDPLDPDSDMDGVEDGDEVEWGLDPNNPSTFNDGVQDGMRPFVQACQSGSPGNTVSYRSAAGDWDLSLPLTYTGYTELSITGANATNGWAAAVFRNASGSVAGMVYAQNQTSPIDLRTALGRFTSNSDASFVREFVTHDGYPALTYRRVQRSSAVAKQLEEHRNDWLFSGASFAASAVTNLPASATPSSSVVRGHITLIDRGGQLVVVGAVSTDVMANYGEVNDAANGSGLSRAMLTGSDICRPFAARTERSPAEVYWVIDGTGSMDITYSNDVKPLWPDFLADLGNSNVSARFAFADMASGNDGRPSAAVGWVDTLSQMEQQADFYANGTDGGNEYGLRNAESGISYLLSSMVAPNLALRPGAPLITVTITDEESQQFQLEDLTNPTIASLLQGYETFFAMNSPFFGLITLDQNCGASQGDAYRRVIDASGGYYGDFCAPGAFADFHEELADTITSKGTAFQLQTRPISGSIRVEIGGVQVPKSRTDGWTYFAETNSIVFYGSAVPALSDPANGVAGDSVTINYAEAP